MDFLSSGKDSFTEPLPGGFSCFASEQITK